MKPNRAKARFFYALRFCRPDKRQRHQATTSRGQGRPRRKRDLCALSEILRAAFQNVNDDLAGHKNSGNVATHLQNQVPGLAS
jgi:hypothetical protein